MSVASRTPSGIGIMTLRSTTAIDWSSVSVSRRCLVGGAQGALLRAGPGGRADTRRERRQLIGISWCSSQLLPAGDHTPFCRARIRMCDKAIVAGPNDHASWRLLRRLRDPKPAPARAAWGEVYPARNPRLGRDVAMNVLRRRLPPIRIASVDSTAGLAALKHHPRPRRDGNRAATTIRRPSISAR